MDPTFNFLGISLDAVLINKPVHPQDGETVVFSILFGSTLSVKLKLKGKSGNRAPKGSFRVEIYATAIQWLIQAIGQFSLVCHDGFCAVCALKCWLTWERIDCTIIPTMPLNAMLFLFCSVKDAVQTE